MITTLLRNGGGMLSVESAGLPDAGRLRTAILRYQP